MKFLENAMKWKQKIASASPAEDSSTHAPGDLDPSDSNAIDLDAGDEGDSSPSQAGDMEMESRLGKRKATEEEGEGA